MKCFVIGPIGDQFADAGSDERRAYEEAVQVFEEIVKAACNSCDVEAYRADDIHEPGEIPEQIFEALRDEQLVIADLTGANPNVMYELGLRHALGSCTLQIGEKGRLPFDINTIRTVQFVRTPHGLIKARNLLTTMIGSSLANGCKPATAARVLGRGTETTADEDDEVEVDLPHAEVDEEPLGFLDALADVETAMPEMGHRLTTMSALLSKIGELSKTAGTEAERSTSAGQRIAILRRFNVRFTEVVGQYDQELVEFENRVATVGAAVDVVLTQLGDPESRSEAGDYLTAMVGMAEAAREAREVGMTPFLSSVEGLEGISREIRRGVRLLRDDVSRTIRAFVEVERWGERASELILPNNP